MGLVVVQHQTLRTIHGWLGLSLAFAVIVYAVGGWMIFHGQRFWGPIEPVLTTHAIAPATLASADRASAGRVARALDEQLDIAGRFVNVKGDPSGWTARYASATTESDARWSDGGSSVEVSVRKGSPGGKLAGLHRTHGTSGGKAFFAWALFVDVLALAMIAFAITGVWLWWRLKARARGPGLFALGASSLLTIAIVLQLTFGP